LKPSAIEESVLKTHFKVSNSRFGKIEKRRFRTEEGRGYNQGQSEEKRSRRW
jgi:hypothetical protein